MDLLKKVFAAVALAFCFSFAGVPITVNSGSGFLINESYVVTAFHVISKYSYACLYDPKMITCYALDLVDYDSDADVAILHLRDFPSLHNFKSCAVAATEVGVGTTVDTYGFDSPIDRNDYNISHYRSYVNNLDNVDGDDRMYCISVELPPGFSGSPNFDERGRVIGISRSISNVEDDVSNIVKSSIILDMIERNGIETSVSTRNPRKCTCIIINGSQEFLGFSSDHDS